MTKPLAPMKTPQSWRAFLYDEIVVTWETNAVHLRSEVYNKRAIERALALYAIKKTRLDEMQSVAAQYGQHAGEFVVFYCEGKGYESLFKRLRDTVAHAHYTQDRFGWITLLHQFKGRGELKPTVRLMARMKFATLKRLVAFINNGLAPRGAPALLETRSRSRSKSTRK